MKLTRENITLSTAHNETMLILKDINCNVARLADLQETQNKIFEQFLKLYCSQQGTTHDHNYF